MTEIETRLFRYFVGLAEEQHFGRAAMNLGISAPTLTQQIKKLEEQLGAKLVQRRGNTHVELTEAGLRVLEHARNVLREAQEAVAGPAPGGRGQAGRSRGRPRAARLAVSKSHLCRRPSGRGSFSNTSTNSGWRSRRSRSSC